MDNKIATQIKFLFMIESYKIKTNSITYYDQYLIGSSFEILRIVFTLTGYTG
jgi:hypothetical protein